MDFIIVFVYVEYEIITLLLLNTVVYWACSILINSYQVDPSQQLQNSISRKFPPSLLFGYCNKFILVLAGRLLDLIEQITVFFGIIFSF